MSGITSPGELAKGQHITVLEWEPVVQEADGIFTTQTITHRDNSYKGDVLRVDSVCLPFVVVENLTGWGGGPIRLDTRRVSLMELSGDYVAAALRKSRTP